MVDERMSMTFSVRNNPGRYALLLGSGVSTEAEIPTGWAVVNELVERVAAADGTSIDKDVDPVEWYEQTYEEPATYENLISGLAKTQTERRKLLEEFFEPSDAEAERGEKQPTDAHQSIAWLVKNGYINVILTTNFDQLIEKALRDQGVNPVVISGPESARGAEPLQHQDAVVVKVNGDYKETNLKNLSSELESYSNPMQQIIDLALNDPQSSGSVSSSDDIAINPITDEDHIRGNQDAAVTVVEYSDFGCPYCAQFHQTMKQVTNNYDASEVAWVYRHFPIPQLHPQAPRLARASECAADLGGQEAFWTFADEVFAGAGN